MIFIGMDNNNKSEKELFEEEINNWPKELEQGAEKLMKEYNILKEEKLPRFNSIDEADKYYQAIPWDEYKKKWLK